MDEPALLSGSATIDAAALRPRSSRIPADDAGSPPGQARQQETAPGQPAAPPATRPVEISVIMPTVFWTGTFERCARRVLALLDAATVGVEAVFVFDGAAPPRPRWLDHPAVTVMATGSCGGPAVARNLAAKSARGSILLFVDADVELADDAIERVARGFAADPDLAGLIGAYDDEPTAQGAASQFRNLLHHHVHSTHPGTAVTFWSGCGAIRAHVFADTGGFDENYAVPSVEDIELGMRIAADGGRLRIDPQLRGKHLKPWTLASMTLTDVVHRAIPWTRLIVSRQSMPATLNIDWRGRASGVCALLLAISLPTTFVVPAASWIVVASVAALVAMNADFYRLCLRKRGLGFAITAVALHWLYFLYSSLTFGIMVIHGFVSAAGRRSRSRGRAAAPRPLDAV